MRSPIVFPKAPCFNPICFEQSPPLLTYIGEPKWEALHLSIESTILGSLHSFNFFFFCDGPIKFTVFPKFSSWSPDTFPIASLFYLVLVCPKLESLVHKLKRWDIQEHICLYFVSEGPKRCFYWGVPLMFPKKIGVGPINVAPLKIKFLKKKLWAHPWTNQYESHYVPTLLGYLYI
jgi:hypothetical protein